MRPALLFAASAVIALTGCASTSASRTTPTPESSGPPTSAASSKVSTPPPLRPVDLGSARIHIPAHWHVAKYQGELATVIFPIAYISDRPLVGPCLSEKRSTGECTTNYWFPPEATTPDDGLLMLWQEWQFPGSYDRLSTVPRRFTVIDHRRARRYSGPVVYGGCPTDSATQISAAVHSSTDRLHNGDGYYVVACLGPHVSRMDRQAVEAMIASLRITR